MHMICVLLWFVPVNFTYILQDFILSGQSYGSPKVFETHKWMQHMKPQIINFETTPKPNKMKQNKIVCMFYGLHSRCVISSDTSFPSHIIQSKFMWAFEQTATFYHIYMSK